jgi:hypothetical protein
MPTLPKTRQRATHVLPESEKRISAKDAGGMFNPRRSTRCIYNWFHRGLYGVKLEYTFVGGQIFTSSEAVVRFKKLTGHPV